MDAELWKRFDIDLQPKAKDFHDGKIYAKLLIEPQSARELIEKFIVNIFSPITKDEQNRVRNITNYVSCFILDNSSMWIISNEGNSTNLFKTYQFQALM